LKVSIVIDDQLKEPKLIIEAPEWNDTIQELLDFIKSQENHFLVGKLGDLQHILKPSSIHYFYSEGDAVFAVNNAGVYKMKEKLYELEAILPSNQFIRLSKSVLANLHELSSFEAMFNGTLCVYFKSGAREYVSRNYVRRIKDALQMNRRR